MRTSPRWRPGSSAAPAVPVVASDGAAAPEQLTERARRSFAGRAAPPAVLALGCIFVAAALYQLDAVYAGDAGVFRSRQLAPRPLASVRAVLVPIGEGLADAFARSGFGRGACARYEFGALCERRPPVVATSAARREPVERRARRLFAGGSGDVVVTVWDEPPDRIVAVTVARYADEQATRRALRASRARLFANAAKNKKVNARTAHAVWPEGKRFAVGMLVTAPTRAAAAEQLKESRQDVSAYMATMRFSTYELLALVPVLLLFALVFGGRALVIMALCVAFIPFGLVVVAGLLVYVLVLLVGRRWGWEPRGRTPRWLRVPFVRGPPSVNAGKARVENLDGEVKNAAAGDRSVMLVLATIVGLGIALLTRSLFPASLVLGSLLVIALYSPAESRRGARWIVRVRKLVRVLVVASVVGVLIGLAPLGLHLVVGVQIVVVAVAAAIVVAYWRDLVTETPVGYAKWYEDIDARSTVFLAGLGLLTLGAAALFLASNGEVDPAAHAGVKLFALVGLLAASSTAPYARAARDAAARERARRRATPHILYLRSFGDDRLRVVSRRLQRRGLERFSWRRTELLEDVIARSLSTIGPVVAIARPGTGQRDLGAARESIVVEDWLSAVKSHMNEAVLVVVVMGSSEGLVRELETLGELGLLDRVCIFVPPVDDDEVARRLNVLARQKPFSDLWGTPQEGWRQHVVALTSRHGDQVALIAKKRRASAYRAVAAYLAR